MVIFCAILPVPPQADPAPRPDGEDVAKGVLEPGKGWTEGHREFLPDSKGSDISPGLDPRALYYRTYRFSLLVPGVRPRASPPHHSFLPWGFLSGEETDRAVLWYHWQENDVRVVAG